MKKESIVHQEYNNITELSHGGSVKITVYLIGKIVRVSNRRLLGIIKLKDKYIYRIRIGNLKRTVETIDGTTEERLKEVRLNFVTKKRIEIERLKLERKLIDLCKQYKQSKQEE